MTLHRETTIGQIEILPATGHVQVRLHVQLYEDGVPIGAPHYHRTVLDPDTDIDAQMKAVNADLVAHHKDAQGRTIRAPIGPALAEWSDLHAHAKAARKPHLVAAHKARKAAAIAEAEAQGNTQEVPVPGLRGWLPT